MKYRITWTHGQTWCTEMGDMIEEQDLNKAYKKKEQWWPKSIEHEVMEYKGESK